MNTIILVSPVSLIPNQTKMAIYGTPKNYEEIKESIKEYGIVEPLLVHTDNTIISGNIRHQISLELGIDQIPIIYTECQEIDLKGVISNQQRQKSYSDILNEIEFYENLYSIKQGQRTDINDNTKLLKTKRDKILSVYSRGTKDKLKHIKKLATELYGNDTEKYKEVFRSLDSGKSSLNGMVQQLMDYAERKYNHFFIPEQYNVIEDNIQIYNHSSTDMFEISDNTVSCIITSPPYYKMKNYQNGQNELGQERTIEEYLDNLMLTFRECKRILSTNGSLFVNLNDCVLGEKYLAIPHYFVVKMLTDGWLLNDELIWMKVNPTYQRGRRSVRSFEPIFHFTKSTEFYYNNDWVKQIEDPETQLIYGWDKKEPKIKSTIDYRDGIVITNVANTSELSKKVEKEGFYMKHQATFPLTIPMICGLLTTQPNDVIVDPFAGTSQTGLFATKFNRRFIGYDVNSKFIRFSEINLKV